MERGDDPAVPETSGKGEGLWQADGRPAWEHRYEHVAWGTVHRDLSAPPDPEGRVMCNIGEPVRIWRGPEAARILDVLAGVSRYPHARTYRLYPGPNCNTFAAWVLREAGVPFDWPPEAVGVDWCGAFGMRRSNGLAGLLIETPVAGCEAGLREGLELHLGGTVWGVDLWPPALKLPCGRLGFPEAGQ